MGKLNKTSLNSDSLAMFLVSMNECNEYYRYVATRLNKDSALYAKNSFKMNFNSSVTKISVWPHPKGD